MLWIIIGGSDFLPITNSSVVLNGNKLSDVIRIAINEDDIVEDNEKFLVTITTTTDRIILSPETQEITIIDNDGKILILLLLNYILL